MCTANSFNEKSPGANPHDAAVAIVEAASKWSVYKIGSFEQLRTNVVNVQDLNLDRFLAEHTDLDRSLAKEYGLDSYLVAEWIWNDQNFSAIESELKRAQHGPCAKIAKEDLYYIDWIMRERSLWRKAVKDDGTATGFREARLDLLNHLLMTWATRRYLAA